MSLLSIKGLFSSFYRIFWQTYLGNGDKAPGSGCPVQRRGALVMSVSVGLFLSIARLFDRALLACIPGDP